jgi:hypothetical protein|nr:hypothetical protein [Kofleriaceae bacterium]
MKIVLGSLIAIAAAASVAHADTPCAATGDVAVEIDHDATAASKLATSKVKLYDSGAWSFDETTGDGKPGRKLTGCLAKADLAKLAAVQAAPWTITHPRAHCMTVGQTSTAFHLKGKPDFVQKTCPSDLMDDKTTAALADLVKLTDAQVAAATHPPRK